MRYIRFMVTHQKRVLKFLLSHESTVMSRKDVAQRIEKMKQEDWKLHVKKSRPDGTCQAGCPLHSTLA